MTLNWAGQKGTSALTSAPRKYTKYDNINGAIGNNKTQKHTEKKQKEYWLLTTPEIL